MYQQTEKNTKKNKRQRKPQHRMLSVNNKNAFLWNFYRSTMKRKKREENGGGKFMFTNWNDDKVKL